MIDARSDLFSLGSLLYALATGRPPYRAESPLAVLRKISETKPKPIHQVNELVPRWFDSLVAKLMSIEQSERIPSADAAASLLRDALAHVCNPAVNTLPTVLTSHRLTRKPLWAGLGVTPIVAGLLLGSAWKWMPNDELPSQSIPQAVTSRERTESPANVALDWHSDLVSEELSSIHRTLLELEEAMSEPSPPYDGLPSPSP